VGWFQASRGGRTLGWPGRCEAWQLLLAVVIVALVVRLAFAFRAPPFVTNDSLSYLLPGFDLIHGDGFSPILKRPPLYSLFVGGVLGAFGEELRVVMLVQHLLGVVTVAATFGLGRLLFGTAAGTIAALLTALSGPIVVTEHYLMSEALFTLLLCAGLLAYFAGLRRRSGPLMLTLIGAAGALLGLAALTRPIAQLVVALLAVAALALLPRWRPAVTGMLATLMVFSIVVLPWMLRNQAVHGTFAIAGGSGEGLAVRTIRYEQTFDFREPPGGDPDRLTSRARRIYRGEAEDGSAFELRARLMDELGVSEVEAERLMRTIALQAILRRPGYYLTGTSGMFVETFVGRPIRLRQDWLPWRNIAWEPRVEHLLPVVTPVEDRAFGAAERLVTVYDPARIAPLLAILATVGTLAGLRGGQRFALLLGLLVLVLLLAGAALIGIEWRYRYPLDPLIDVLAAGGLVTLLALAVSGVRRARLRRNGATVAAPAGTAT
jgi:4-amino-4-deoxy-L-arabinose transferase-like glycosyltransferase